MNSPIDNIVEYWRELQQLSPPAKENAVGQSFVTRTFSELGYSFDKLDLTQSIQIPGTPGLIPDFLVFGDNTKTQPRLVVEIKRRDESLLVGDFISNCQRSGSLYREAVGYCDNNNNNGIRQYLDIEKVRTDRLAPFGLVTNGDFFQLWRRIDGLVMPLTPLERLTENSIPRLMVLLHQILDGAHFPLAVSMWNRKGGTGKTTNTVNVAACLAKAGKRVLLVDLDPQGDCTRNLGMSPDSTPDYLTPLIDAIELGDNDQVAEVLANSIIEKTFKTTSGGEFQLSILPCNSDSVERIKAATADSKKTGAIFKIVPTTCDSFGQNYDYVFFDAAPSPDRLTSSILANISAYCLPMDGLEAAANASTIFGFIVEARTKKRENEESLRRKGYQRFSPDSPYVIGAVRSNWSLSIGGLVDKEIQKMFAAHGSTDLICSTTLRTSDHIAICSMRRVPIACWDNSPSTKLFQSLTDELFLKHKFVGASNAA